MTRAQALSLLLLGQLGLCAWTRALGIVAISDDDYARVVIAQTFAEMPTLDPSGTSWLPLPFLLTGSVMACLGATLQVARGVAVALALGAALLLYGAGRICGLARGVALLVALSIASLPTIRALSIATVPEYWSAALITYGSATLLTPGRTRWLGALALALASACRYEAWPAALGFAALTAWDLRRGSPRRWSSALAALVTLAFPSIWMLHGSLHHGSALFFVERVSSYKAALGQDPRNLIELLTSYPLALLTREPEVTALFFAALLTHLLLPTSPGTRSPASLRIFVPSVALLTGLVAGDVRGGAPTHHAERALIALWMLGMLWSASTFTRLGVRRAGLVIALCLGLCLPFRLRLAPPSYAQRSDEEAIGQALGRLLAPTERVLLATPDFGYFAVQAAAAHPSRFGVLERHDPRERPSTQPPLTRLPQAMQQAGACFAVVPLCWELTAAVVLAQTADYQLVRATDRACPTP